MPATDDVTSGPVEAPGGPPPSIPGRLRVGAIASLGAGAIHATAAGAHGEHRSASIAFAVIAAAQISWGVLALIRSDRVAAVAGVAVGGVAVGGWVLAKTSGIGLVDGLDAREAPQLADTVAAALAVVAIVCAAPGLRPRQAPVAGPRRPVPTTPALVAVTTLVTVALVVPGMISTGGHAHSGGHAETAGHGGDATDGAHGDTAAPPRPYDATIPVDLGGVPGVTADQQADAEALVTATLERLPQFADVATAEARGYRSIGDELSGWEHYIRWDLMDDGVLLDPDLPESLVYEVDPATRQRTLVAAMFMAGSQATLDDVPDVGGDLVQWHIHNDLCYGGEPGAWRLAGYAVPPAPCPPGTDRLTVNPMTHVWITPHRCGPFASLEGVGAGQIAAGEERACDHAHGSPG